MRTDGQAEERSPSPIKSVTKPNNDVNERTALWKKRDMGRPGWHRGSRMEKAFWRFSVLAR
ncbi:MAG: hypothetical protein DMG39_30180 [Acidobacteria bacterium]|nr:MAG: hypothetical protein DMG39_30180 [Acidobacteriota bacterium]